MAKEKEKKCNKLAVAVSIIILFIVCIGLSIMITYLNKGLDELKQLAIQETEYKYTFIELNDKNKIFSNVEAYLCSNEVDTQYLKKANGYLYISTWKDGKVPHSIGSCYIKIKID